MKTNELRKLTTEELNKKVTECKEELFSLRMQKATGMIEKPSRINELRKEVARITRNTGMISVRLSNLAA